MEKKREIWLDVLRAFACMCVVLVHSPAKYDGQIPGQSLLAPLNYVLMSWGVGLFFTISGALLLSKPVNLSEFYKKRFGKLIIPVIVWSIIYTIYEGWLDGGLSWTYFWRKVAMIPFYNQTPLLWFMYTLFGIYLVAPVFSYFLNSANRRDVEVLLGLWGVVLLIPYLKLWNKDVCNMIAENGALHSFTGFLWYAIFGYYLRKYIDWKPSNWKFITLLVVSFVFPVIVYFTNFFPTDTLNTQMSVSSVAMTSIPFILFKNFSFKKLKKNNIVLILARYSFGVYLCHWLFLKPLRLYLTQFHIHYAIQIPLTAIIVCAASLIVTLLLSKLPFKKIFVG